MRALPLCLCFISLSAAFAQVPSKPNADRSAEARLKQVFEAMGKVKILRASVFRSTRESKQLPWSQGGSIDLAYEAGKGFQVMSSGGWGDQLLFTSDGKTFVSDPLDYAQGVYVKDLKPTIYECDTALAMRGSASTLLFYFLAGSKAFDEVVDKNGEIVSTSAEDSFEAIRFKSTRLGTVKILFEPKHRYLLIRRIEFDDLDNKKELARLYAEWGFEVPEDPLDVHTVTYLSVDKRLPRNVFVTRQPKDIQVHDQRKSAKKPSRS